MNTTPTTPTPLSSIDAEAHVGNRHHHVEVVEENPGQFSWRVVLRDADTLQEIGAPEQSIQLYATETEARDAGLAAVERIEGGIFSGSTPRATP